MANRVVHVAANQNGDVWCVDDSERIWVSPNPGGGARTWSTPTDGFAVKIAINNTYAFCVNHSNQVFVIPLGGTTWFPFIGAPLATDVAIGTDSNDFALVDVLSRIWRYNFSTSAWEEPDPRGIAVQVALRDFDHLYCVNRVREIFYFDTAKNLWQEAKERKAQDIDFIPGGGIYPWEHWIVDENGYFWRWTDANKWQNPATGGRGVQMVAVSKDHIWSVNNQGQLWEWVDGRSPAWIEHKIPFPGFYYTVVWGDTLTSIAKHFGKTVQDLLDANPSIVNPDLIFPGQVILIPA